MAIVWVGLVLVGPPALLFWLVRRRRRRARAAAQTASSVAAAAPAVAQVAGSALPESSPSNPQEANPQEAPQQAGNGYSFPYGVPLLIYPLLAIALPAARHNIWFVALLLLLLVGLAAGFTHLALSRTEFDNTRRNDPSMTLATWRINWLLFFAAPPALLAVFGAAALLKLAAG